MRFSSLILLKKVNIIHVQVVKFLYHIFSATLKSGICEVRGWKSEMFFSGIFRFISSLFRVKKTLKSIVIILNVYVLRIANRIKFL